MVVEQLIYILSIVKVQVNAPHNQWAKIAKAMKAAANELGITITWGGDWKSFVDTPHYQIEGK